MAGDWIKMRLDLPEDPAVYRIARLTGLDRLAVVGRLYAFWAWADKHAVDGHVDGGESVDVDEMVSHAGFAEAMVKVGWLQIADGSLTIPKHERHNGESAKERSLKNARQARWRDKQDANATIHASTRPSTREEKRREEKEVPNGTLSPAKLPTCPTQAIVDMYHEVLPELPSVRLMDDKRKRAIAGLWKFALTSKKPDGQPRAQNPEEAKAWARQFFERARANDFLMGRNSRDGQHSNWKCDLDFLLTDRGMKHVIEKTQDAS